MSTKSPDPLITLRSAISKGLEPKLLSSDGQDLANEELSKAETLQIPVDGGEPISFALKDLTRYESKVPSKMLLDLRVVYNCWLTRDLKVTDYIEVSDERGIFNLKFVERADLLSWLRGDSPESENIVTSGEKKSVTFTDTAGHAQSDTIAKPGSGAIEKKGPDPGLEKIYEKERALQNHNSILRGSKVMVSI